MDRVPGAASWSQPVLVRFEYGWGPWPALGIGGVADWNLDVRVQGGELLSLQPCFLSGPFEEGRRDRISGQSRNGFTLESFTSLRQTLEDYSQKAVVLKIAGSPATRPQLSLRQPRKVEFTCTLGQLAQSNEILFTAEFPHESAAIDRVVFEENYRTSFTFRDEDSGGEVNWY